MYESCSIDPSRRRTSDLGLRRAHAPKGHKAHFVPHVNESGELEVDPWWGVIQPQQLHPEIKTIGELEMIEHLERGGRAIDTRKPNFVAESGTIPGAIPVPWEEICEHLDDLDDEGVTVLFCNGPACPATPRAIEKLLDSGYPPERLAYYRGGIQDWMAVGLPMVEVADRSD